MSRRPPLIGIVGPGDAATPDDLRHAESLGRLVAQAGWVVVNGGVASGVMEAASRGARDAGGVVIGILPGAGGHDASSHLSVALVTGMGQARNHIIVLSSDVLVVCGMSAGTAVEAAIAIRATRPLVFIAAHPTTRAFYERLDPAAAVVFVDTADEAMAAVRGRLSDRD